MVKDLTLVECQGAPPQIVMVPQQLAGGQALVPTLIRPNMPRRQPCCALFAPKAAPAALTGLPGLMGDA